MRRYDYSKERRLYRSRSGLACGVCAGLGKYLELHPGWLRLFVIIIMLFTGIWPVLLAYFLACLLMKPEPVVPLENESQRDFYDGYVDSRGRALRDLKRRFSSLDRRLRRMEDTVTSRDFEWEQRLNS
jgi:phage shock protein C